MFFSERCKMSNEITPEPTKPLSAMERTTSTSSTSPRMNFEEKMKLADLVIKAVGALLLIVGAWVNVALFITGQEKTQKEAATQAAKELTQRENELTQRKDQQQRDFEQRKKEFSLKFYEKQLALYLEVCDAAARIATAKRLEEVQADLRLFDQLYWGKMCVIESTKVEAAQRTFYEELVKTSYLHPKPSEKLLRHCYLLAHACRDDLKELFDSPIGNLPVERKGQVVTQLEGLTLNPKLGPKMLEPKIQAPSPKLQELFQKPKSRNSTEDPEMKGTSSEVGSSLIIEIPNRIGGAVYIRRQSASVDC